MLLALVLALEQAATFPKYSSGNLTSAGHELLANLGIMLSPIPLRSMLIDRLSIIRDFYLSKVHRISATVRAGGSSRND